MKRLLKWIGIVLASLIVLPMITLLVMGHRPNAGKVHASTEIAASREQVWQWLDNNDRLKQWVSWLVDVQEPQPGPHAVGSHRVWVMKDENNGGELLNLDGVFKEYQPPSNFTVAIASPLYQFDGSQSYRLTDLGNGRTRIDIDGRYHYQQWLANLMEPLVTPLAQKKMVGDLARLKTLMETKAELRK